MYSLLLSIDLNQYEIIFVPLAWPKKKTLKVTEHETEVHWLHEFEIALKSYRIINNKLNLPGTIFHKILKF